MQKKELRQEIRNRKRQFTEEQLRELSLPVINKLLAHPRVNNATTLMLYHSMPDEVYTHELIDLLVERGKTVLLPKMLDDQTIEPRIYRGRQNLKEDGAFHIQEPTGEVYSESKPIEVIIVPGMGFDDCGNRIGRGRGYYDRFLKTISPVYKIGVCFDFQRVESVPTDENDIRMDEVIDNREETAESSKP